MNNRKLVWILAAFVLLTACGPDPRREADAYATRAETDRANAAAKQARQQSEDLHALEMQSKQMDLETKQEAVTVVREVRRVGTYIIGLVLVAALAYSIGRTAYAYGTAVQGVGDAISRAAILRANLIPLDRITRQYPIYLQYMSAGRYALVNPNINSTILLDTRNEADRQMIASVSGVQIAGVIAQEARKSSDPAGMAIMRPPVIDAQEGELLTGANLMAEIAKTSQILAGGRDE